MMVAMLVMSEKLEKWPGETPGSVSTSNLQWNSLRFSVICFPPLLEGTPRGSWYMHFLGQADQSEMKMDGIGGSRAKRGQVAQLTRGSRHQCPFGPRGLPDFLCPRRFSWYNINAQKISCQIDFGKVPKSSKYTKQGFPVPQSYNQNKGDQWKIPINQCKTWL
jgi:hypothetical protein